MPKLRPAPAWSVETWLNSPHPLTLEGLRGRVILLGTFQMLCPGCVQVGLPQLARAYDLFPRDQVAVIGLHTVFEHHSAMNEGALRAFVHEYRLKFPIGIDRPGAPLPETMARYDLQGTPSVILIDRLGRLRLKRFGHVDDLWLGAQIGALLTEPLGQADFSETAACTPEGCTP
ncbi:MAG: peroxiredoxin family protein [Elstera sp.]|jgi:hypothetical protein